MTGIFSEKTGKFKLQNFSIKTHKNFFKQSSSAHCHFSPSTQLCYLINKTNKMLAKCPLNSTKIPQRFIANFSPLKPNFFSNFSHFFISFFDSVRNVIKLHNWICHSVLYCFMPKVKTAPTHKRKFLLFCWVVKAAKKKMPVKRRKFEFSLVWNPHHDLAKHGEGRRWFAFQFRAWITFMMRN